MDPTEAMAPMDRRILLVKLQAPCWEGDIATAGTAAAMATPTAAARSPESQARCSEEDTATQVIVAVGRTLPLESLLLVWHLAFSRLRTSLNNRRITTEDSSRQDIVPVREALPVPSWAACPVCLEASPSRDNMETA